MINMELPENNGESELELLKIRVHLLVVRASMKLNTALLSGVDSSYVRSAYELLKEADELLD